MCWPGSRSHASAMNTTTRTEPGYRAEPERTALRRPIQDRMLTGVAAGLAEYFGVDVTIVRVPSWSSPSWAVRAYRSTWPACC
jgi:hypothetical protein